ncbi:MAG: Trk system potassium transporter TrkA [Burkholderiales bacterium]|nr:Trk system potassium transporter TrkA [Burkholderiales bacterium]
MKILILGAGQVGASVAESLVSEKNDVTVVDTSAERLRDLASRFNLRTVTGNAAHPEVLADAGAADTDMLFAVTASDETNLVASKVGHAVFNIPTRIARIRSTWFQSHPQLLESDCFSVSHAICPEQIVTEYIGKLIEFPEALQVAEFAGGKIALVAVRAIEGGPIVRHPLHDLEMRLPTTDVKVAAIYRHDRPMPLAPETVVQAGDEVFFVAAAADIRGVMAEMRQMDRPVARVIIAGGGNIGLRLARALEDRLNVKVIEASKRRCEFLAGQLGTALVLNGDVSNEDLLGDENVDDTDLFVAVTNDDEANIMSALLAKRMGARRVIALINRRAYGDLMQGGQIDIAISPAQATLGSLLEHVRRGDVVAVHSVRRGRAEALELIAHGDRRTSRVVGRRIREIDLPPGATIVGIIRGGEAIVAEDDGHVIEAEDHVLVFLTQKRMIPKVEKLFEVGVGFF